jgi:hypothetical protein
MIMSDCDKANRKRVVSKRRCCRPRHMNEPLLPFAVYTIRHSSELDASFVAGGMGQFTEHKKWTSGLGLFEEAKRVSEHLPIIFAGAECIDGLLYWAVVTELNSSDDSTTYSFAGLRRLQSKPPLRSLRLRSTGAPLSDNYIRPYAIVHTPDSVRTV